MQENKYEIILSADEYKVLLDNDIIAMLNRDVLEQAQIKDQKAKLLLNILELEELNNSISSEINYTKSKKRKDELNIIYESLELQSERIFYN